jgi:hypothetical protein
MVDSQATWLFNDAVLATEVMKCWIDEVKWAGDMIMNDE